MYYKFEKVNCIDEHSGDQVGGINLHSLQNDLIENKMQLHERELSHAWSIFSIRIINLARELDERKCFTNNKKPTQKPDFYIF